MQNTPEQMAASRERRIPLESRQEIIDTFHRLAYDEARRGKTWHAARWRGFQVLKWPCDLWLYQEVIANMRPKTIIEVGTAHGGSALYLADLTSFQRSDAVVVSIDINRPPTPPYHPRIKFIQGDSLSVHLPASLLNPPVMVILDSDHAASHVYKELDKYAPLVTKGQYLVVEDTNLNGHPVHEGFGQGPMEALEKWHPGPHGFIPDKALADSFLFSFHTWLRRIT